MRAPTHMRLSGTDGLSAINQWFVLKNNIIHDLSNRVLLAWIALRFTKTAVMSLLIIKLLQFMVSNSFQNILMYAVILKMFVCVHVNRILLLIFEQLKIL